jgi:hypothetical protein
MWSKIHAFYQFELVSTENLKKFAVQILVHHVSGPSLWCLLHLNEDLREGLDAPLLRVPVHHEFHSGANNFF